MDTFELDRLKEFRNWLRLTPKQFAEELNVSYVYYSAIERGAKSLSASLINTLIDGYGLSYDWLRTGQGNMLISKTAISNTDTSALENEYMREYRLLVDLCLAYEGIAHIYSNLLGKSEFSEKSKIFQDLYTQQFHLVVEGLGSGYQDLLPPMLAMRLPQLRKKICLVGGELCAASYGLLDALNDTKESFKEDKSMGKE